MNSFVCHGYTTSISCVQCGDAYILPVNSQQIKAWQEGELIQRAMPNISNEERELFISGLCGKCFDAVCAGEDSGELRGNL